MHPLTRILSRKLREDVEDLGGVLNLPREMEVDVSRLKEGASPLVSMLYLPRAGVYRQKEEIEVLLEVPGYEKEDLEVSVPDKADIDEVTISGKKEESVEGEKVFDERPSSFERTVELPEACLSRGVSASVEEGLLHVRLQRSEPGKGRSVDIE